MKKFLVALTFALTLAVASTALAQTPPVGPRIGGDLTGFMSLSTSDSPAFVGRLRLTLSGAVNDRVDYAGRFVNWFWPDENFYFGEGTGYGPSFDYGFASIRNVGPAERVDVGAIPVNRSPLRHFEGLFDQFFRFPGVVATSRVASNAAISLGVGPISDPSGLHGNLLGDFQYRTSFGDFGVGAAQLYHPASGFSIFPHSAFAEREFRVRAAVPVMGDAVKIYGEAGATQRSYSSPVGEAYDHPVASAVIGVNFPRLAKTTGYDVAGEYDLTNNVLGWELAKGLMPGVTFRTEGEIKNAARSGYDLATQTSLMVSF
ncbi:MAG: hypothetical protein M1379_07055 [Firmicutes bacterium]|nr:hypothetical protein [Bacillota bacterium]